MTRVNVYSYPAEDDYISERRLVGWFDRDKAYRWSDADYNGNGSGGTARGQAVLITAQGKWVLENWSRWQDEGSTYEYIAGEQARDWLLRNGEDTAVADHFGPIPGEEDRRPGRPEVGGAVHIRLGDLLPQVDAYAGTQALTRAEALRRLIAAGLTEAGIKS